MNAGQLRHKITIQNATTANDEFGQAIKTWVDSATVWAAIVPLSGREFEQAKLAQAETTHKIKIRYTTTINNQSQLVFGVRVFEVLSVINIEERNIEMEILAKERL